MDGTDVAIVGGGVIGLSIAYALAREGVRATVLDRDAMGRAASWAGAGIIAPGSSRPTADPMAALRTLSARLHPQWADSLRDETGLDTGYRLCGGVDVALTAADEAALGPLAARWKAEGIAFERVGPDDLRRVEPGLSPEVRSAFFLPGRAQIRNPRHLRALAVACWRRGVRLRPGLAAEGFDRSGGRVVAVRTAEGPLACDRVVVAAGPWSGPLLEGLGLRVPTPPIKGQIVLFRASPPVLGRIVEHGSNYLVPRDDGRVLAGSTEEDAGFDVRATPGAVRDLIDEALRLCPALGSAEIERAWAGLRPGSGDARPYLGPVPGIDGLYLATGHRRAGLQLSPGTAVVVVDLVLGHPPRIDLADLRVGRPPSREEPGPFRS